MKRLPDVEPAVRSRPARIFAAIDRGVRRRPALRAFLLWPVWTRPGFWFATACAFLYGLVLRGRFRRRNGMHYFLGMPAWSLTT